MILTRTRSPLVSALFALILGLFVAGPLVDAATCGLEGVDSCEVVLTDGVHGDDAREPNATTRPPVRFIGPRRYDPTPESLTGCALTRAVSSFTLIGTHP